MSRCKAIIFTARLFNDNDFGFHIGSQLFSIHDACELRSVVSFSSIWDASRAEPPYGNRWFICFVRLQVFGEIAFHIAQFLRTFIHTCLTRSLKLIVAPYGHRMSMPAINLNATWNFISTVATINAWIIFNETKMHEDSCFIFYFREAARRWLYGRTVLRAIEIRSPAHG